MHRPISASLHSKTKITPMKSPHVLFALLITSTAFSQQAAPLAPKPEDEAVRLSVFTVSEEKDVGYESLQSTSGSRTAENLKDLANSISVVNSQLIGDVGAQNISELSKWFVTGEADPNPHSTVLIFRGVANNFGQRDGMIWYSPSDSYNMGRVELARGPNGFLYGETGMGGSSNINAKQPLPRPFGSVELTLGSFENVRAVVDLNQPLRHGVIVRVNAAASHTTAFHRYGLRNFKGLTFSASWRPTRTTYIDASFEHAENVSNATTPMRDGYSFTDRGVRSPTLYAANNNADLVYLPASRTYFRRNSPGQRVSVGTGLADADFSVMQRVSRKFNFAGADNLVTRPFSNFKLKVEQSVGKSLSFLLDGRWYSQLYDGWSASDNTIYRDLNATLPDGSANPNVGKLYAEYQRSHRVYGNVVRDLRLQANYDFEVKWMKQRLVLFGQQHQDNNSVQASAFLNEFIDPENPAFSLGNRTSADVFNSAPTAAAFAANRSLMSKYSQRVLRRFYLDGGDYDQLTRSTYAVPGVSKYLPSMGNYGATGALINRFYTPSWGAGLSGSYLQDRLFTKVGWRHDQFRQALSPYIVLPYESRDQVTLVQYPSDNPAFSNKTFSPVWNFNSYNTGVVIRPVKWVGFSWNRAQNASISSGLGGNTYRLGQTQGINEGTGDDYGIRFSLFDGRLEFNVTRYDNYQPNNRLNGVVTQTGGNSATWLELTTLFPTAFDPVSNGDTQHVQTTGYEYELVGSPVRNIRFMANFANNYVETNNRLLVLKSFQADARKQNLATPNLDALLLTYPDHVPNAGYTKQRANFFGRYEFKSEALKGVYVGGGFNWRSPTYRGNISLTGSGVATPLWAPSYTLYTLIAGYETKIKGHATSFGLNISNLFDKQYFRATGTTSAGWGDPRTIRMTTKVSF
jgi:hypothetical protein